MKVGDLVKFVRHDEPLSNNVVVGTIIAPWKSTEWWEILASNGMVIQWPESQLELVNESR